jgi:hypothetical protein
MKTGKYTILDVPGLTGRYLDPESGLVLKVRHANSGDALPRTQEEIEARLLCKEPEGYGFDAVQRVSNLEELK